ncbi:MAG: hypothetical protein JSW11_20065 [Candidatus Heimdallarchaeota archaeon]|nr:MAG: hypothetical protein JSW11_20065 [Candidatus Heimdallarchaeota archaeon]
MIYKEGGSCESCNHPLQSQRDAVGKKFFICVNSKCPVKRLTNIETRLAAIEKLLEITPIIPKAQESVIEIIRTLPNLSLEEGRVQFYSLFDQLEESRDILNFFLEQTANNEYLSPQFLQEWAILMAYSGKTFMAAQRILTEKGYAETPLSQTFISKNIGIIIDRSNSVQAEEKQKIVSTQFYSHLLNWAVNEGFSRRTLETLQGNAGIFPPPIEQTISEEIATIPSVPAREIPSPINQPIESLYQQPFKKWIDRFRPDEGWEFTIGANWLRWVGIGIILFALLLLVVWSASQMKLTEDEIALLTFIGLVFSGVSLHIFSFILLRFKERSHHIPPIAYSIAFLSLGIYYIALFTLRFHPSSPVYGVEYEILYLILCVFLILISCGTAWGHNSSILFIEGFTFTLWLFWHILSQIFVNDLVFSIEILLLGYIAFILAFLGIGYLRKDIILIISVQLMAQLLIFLPNSSKVLSTHSVIREYPDINATIFLVVIISITYLVITLRFPFDISPQFYEIITRYHLSIASVTPIFSSFFLLTFKSISGLIFIPYLVVFTTAFLGLAYYQKDLAVAFSLILLTQLLWLISVGFVDNITFTETIPEINGILTVLLYLTFFFWIIAQKFPSDEIETCFWDYINRKHLSVAAIGPIFISFIISRFNYVTSDIFIMYLVLFCILWSTNRSITLEMPDFLIKKVSLFDIVTYSSAILFLITIILEQSENLFGVVLGFIAFPLFILFNQSISNMSLQQQEIREIYAIINCLFVAIIFSFMVMKETFSNIGIWISTFLLDWGIDFLEFLGLQNSYNWTFIGFLWIVAVVTINVKIFQPNIRHSLSKIIMTLSSPTIIYIYLGLIDEINPIHLAFVIIGYVQLIILWFFLTSEKTDHAIDRHLIFIPGVALLQLSGNFLLTTSIGSWNILSAILVNIFFPFSLGFFMVARRLFHHLIDSYLIISASILTLFQFLYLKSNQQGLYAWFLELVFLILGLVYISARLYFGKKPLGSISTSLSILKFFYPSIRYSNKEQIGLNLLVLCFLGLINNTLCFIFFPTAWSPTLVFLLFDSMVVLPLVFALTLFGLDSHVAIVNTLTLYASGLIIRLPLLVSYPFDYNIHLLIGLVFQLILHGLLVRLSKSTRVTSSLTLWKIKFEGRKTWPEDSLIIMAIINPLAFFFYASQLTLRIGEVFKITNVLPMMILSILIAIYFVIETRLLFSSIISDSGLLISIIIAWLFTVSLLEFIYFTTAATAFLSILYGFWINKREWRILGILIISISLVYSAIYLAQIPDDLVKILGFGILGIISVVIAFVYSKFARRFIAEEFQEKTSIS